MRYRHSSASVPTSHSGWCPSGTAWGFGPRAASSSRSKARCFHNRGGAPRLTDEPNPIPIGLPFLSIGVAEAALDALREHANGRIIPTTGQPLGQMQWVQFGAAEQYVRLRAATLLAAHTAWLADQRSPAANACSLEAKLLANEVAKDVAALGVKVGGGSGYLKTSPIQRHFRDAQAGALMAYSAEVCQAEIGKALLAVPS